MRSVYVALCAAFLNVPAFAADDPVKVPFLFGADETVPQTDFDSTTLPSDALRTDPFLNAPITRLEYILTQMEKRLNNSSVMANVMRALDRGFEPNDGPLGDSLKTVSPAALYFETKGDVIIGISAEYLGRPRIPMKETCEALLTQLSTTLPNVPLGYLLANTVLGVLVHKKKLDEYVPTLAKLADRFVYRVILNAQAEKGQFHYGFACQRDKSGRTSYSKSSFRINPPVRLNQ